MPECACELGRSTLPLAFGFSNGNNMWTSALCTLTIDTYTCKHTHCLSHLRLDEDEEFKITKDFIKSDK